MLNDTIPKPLSRFTVLLPAEYHKTLKRRALERDVSLSALVREALKHYVKTQPNNGSIK